MSEDLRHDLAPAANEPVDPVKMARRDLQKTLPRRFYKEVSVAEAEAGGGYGPRLDGKPIRTPARAELAVPTRALAEAIAAEWRAQADLVDPSTMPLTRLANSALDGVARTMAATVAEIAKFAETDLVCYRAGDPQALVAAQSEKWDPVLAFARDALGARFICVEGLMYVEQPPAARQAVRAAVESIAGAPAGALRIAALSVITSLTGSVLLALAVAHGAMDAASAWAAACVDEDHQARFWGEDAEASARHERRWRDMDAAATLYALAA
jgi:chaperone required for assembly of F1-ATPase